MKRLLSFLLVFCLMISMTPFSLAENAAETETEGVVEQVAEAGETAENTEEAKEPAEKKAEEVKPAEEKKEEVKPAEKKTEEAKPAEEKTEEVKPAEEKTEEVKPAEEKTEEVKPAEEKKDNSSEEMPDLSDAEDLTAKAAPPKVENFKAVSTSATSINLTWNTVTGVGGYEVRWGTADNFEKATEKKEATSNSLAVSGLECGVTYYYWIRAFYGTYSAPSGIGAEVGIAYHTSPSNPTSGDFDFNLTANSAISLKFQWKKVPEASGYYIYRVDDTNTEVQVAKITKNTDANPTFTLDPIVPAEKLRYRIYSYRVVSSKEVKSEGGTYKEKPYEVPKVKNLKAVSTGVDSVKLSWTAVNGATKYVITRTDGTGAVEKTFEQTEVTLTDSGLIFATEYTYFVVAYVDSFAGGEEKVDVTVTGAAPEDVKVDNDAEKNSNILTWSKSTGAIGYQVQWCDDYDAKHPSAASWSASIDVGVLLEYEHTGLTLGKSYSYRVQGYKEIAGNKVATPWSLVVTIAAKPAVPKGLALINKDYSTQTFSWDPVTGATGYEVDYGTDSTFVKKTTKKVTGTSFDHTGCVNGTKYYYRVRAYVEIGTQKVYGAYSDSKALTCAPAKPTVTASYTPGVNQVKVSWGQVTGATHYQIFYKENDKDWVKVAEVAATASTQTYTVKNLTVGSSYVFGVASVRKDSNGTGVGQRGTSSAVELKVKPYIPQNLKKKIVSSTSIKLTWDKMNGVSTYVVSGTCTELPEYKLDKKSTTDTSMTITDLKTGYAYVFTVQCMAVVDGAKEYSDPATITVVQTPLAPTDLAIKVLTTKYGCKLTWKKAADASGYVVQRSLKADSGWADLAVIEDAETLSYIDTSLGKTDAGKTYFYRVFSYVEHGGKHRSPASNVVNGVVKPPKAEVTVTAVDKTHVSIDVTNDADINADYYLIYRSTSKSSGYKQIKKESTLPYVDTVKFGTVYYYKVRGVVMNTIGGKNVKVNGPTSEAVKGEGKLKAVQGVAVAAIHGGSVKIKWNKLSGATGYNVYYRKEGQSWKKAGSVGKTVKTSLVKGLDPKSKYSFRVAGTAKVGENTVIGQYSSIVTATTKMEKTLGVKTSAVNSTSMKVTFKKVVDAMKYMIYLEDPKDPGVWKKVKTVTKNTATLTGLGKNKSYNVKVRAYIKRHGIAEYGEYSDVVFGNTAPVKPASVKVSGVKKTTATLTWKESADADGYQIRYRINGGTWEPAIQVTGVTEFVLRNLTSGKNYRVQIRAFGNENNHERYGAWSDVVTFKTK